jgi:hypothetical protein
LAFRIRSGGSEDKGDEEKREAFHVS